MRITKVLGACVAAAALMASAACGGGNSGGGKSLDTRAKDDKKLIVGVKFDQPGLGLKQPDGKVAGFDVDVATYIAKELGVEESAITWKEAKSADRESLIKKGEVDYIAATYSITDARKNEVTFAGPYFVAGQDLLVRVDNTDITGPETLNGKRLCSVKGSVSATNLQKKYANEVQLQEFDRYADCVQSLINGSIDAVSTDDTILAGFAAQNVGRLKLIGKPFSEEKYGVGLRKGDTQGQKAVNTAIEKMFSSGAWKAALEKRLGPAGYQIPNPPTITEK
jgi:glutamate transport system substrate-binding protein